MATNHHRSKPLVLVADDDVAVRLLIRHSLEGHGLRIEECGDGLEAVANFERDRPDLVLLDVNMPYLDGFSACERMRTLDTDNIPIIMITGLEDVASIEKAFSLGATDFITKPINWPLLYHRVRYILRASEIHRELGRSESRLSQAQRIARLGNWEWNLVSDEFYCSEEVLRILQRMPENFIGLRKAFLSIIPGADRRRVRRAVEKALAARESYQLEHRVKLPSGEERFLHHLGEVVVDKDNQPVLLHGILQDVTERKRAEEQIRFLAYYDSLTGLPNRRLFKELAQFALNRTERTKAKVALLFLDLDRFKRINDTLGHPVGDEVLKKIAQTLRRTLRSADILAKPGTGDELVLAHLGGDEFTILLSNIETRHQAQTVADRLLDAVTQPLNISGKVFFLTGSLGIALYPDDGDSVDTLLKNAETAMFAAKVPGSSFKFYASPMNERALQMLVLEKELREALQCEQLILHYQPLLDLRSDRIVGLEALVRWNHPEKGLIMPNEFIPLAEETGLILPLGEWVLQKACAQTKAWLEANFGPLKVSVNLSTSQFKHKSLAERVSDALQVSGLPPELLALEITETVLMEDVGEAAAILESLKRLGLKLCMDDFGTGYSSMSYLRKFPFDILKIDRSFVSGIARDPVDAEIVKAIIVLAKALGLEIVAEGVETQDQLTLLSRHRCDVAQGFLVGRPLPPDEIATLLAEKWSPAGR